ncbi:unnamed protein product [Acanthoscelides obtectus]|uniref:Nucleic-acid-binding protein from transposon X-element n=1 Tax=Acanthoscelides obtectus TaxID=200917 RepID=A0A9P0JKB5_ACAOB|nr:unnamed protein product [Acanthoscelides obtectus]CAK1665840.1 hypothetical protein AOBTE_LOCUS24998 [Acanthoscelides obtectus]
MDAQNIDVEEAEKRTDDTDFSVATRRRKRVRVSSSEEEEEPRQRKMPAATKKSGPRATRTTEAPMAGTGVPPINIEGTADWSSLSRMMNSKGIQFSKARTAGTSVKVFTNTPADYRQLVALLESIKRPFFTYQLKEDRMDQRVIRGLPREMSVNDIKEDLVSQGIADAVVQQLTSRTTKKPLPLFLVKTKMPEKLAEIQRLAMLTMNLELSRSGHPVRRRPTPIPVAPPRVPTPMPSNNNNALPGSTTKDFNILPSSTSQSTTRTQHSPMQHDPPTRITMPRSHSKAPSHRLDNEDVRTGWINPRLISKVGKSFKVIQTVEESIQIYNSSRT